MANSTKDKSIYNTMDLSIVIPCYNEEYNIPNILPTVIEWAEKKAVQVICVDDGSSDDTWKHMNAWANKPNLILKHHSRNRGYGAAIKTGITSCRTKYCITFDADGQHDLANIETLYGYILLNDAEMCIGDRSRKGSTSLRNLAKRFILFFVKLFIALRINDLNSGMKMYLTESAKKVLSYCPDGMSFSDIIVLNFEKKRFKIVEHPITVHERQGGKSTISFRTAIETLVEIIYLIINFFPLKFFAIIGCLLFLSGLIWSIPFILRGVGLTTGSSFIFFTSILLVLNGILLENINRIIRTTRDD